MSLSYKPLPNTILGGESEVHIVSPYSTEIEDIIDIKDELGLYKISLSAEAEPPKTKAEKYSREEKKHWKDPNSSLKAPKPEKAAPRDIEENIQDQLHNACLEGKLAVIKDILDKHFVTLMPDDNGRTPLFTACIGDQRKIVEYLILHGYDVNHQDNEGKTPLHIAFEYDQPDIAKILINQFHASLKVRDAQQWSPLHTAIDRGYFSVSERLMQEFLEEDTGTDVSWIQLQAASHDHRLQTVQFLLDTKADVNRVSSSGNTALYVATRENATAVMKCLLTNGANPNVSASNAKPACHKAVLSENCEALECLLKSPNLDINFADQDGDTCLHLAAYRNNLAVCELLLQHGPDVDRVNYKCASALHVAVAKRNAEITHALLKKNANMNLTDRDGDTPLHIAVMQRDHLLVKVFCQYGPQMNMKNFRGLTPLHCAIHQGEHDIIQVLLANTADPNATDDDGDTCLLLALYLRDEACIAMLLQAAANVNAADSDGDSSLHMAVHKGCSQRVIQTLIDHGAQLNAINNKSQTPLLIACGKRQIDCVNVLLNAGANPDTPDLNGNTSLHIAIHNGFSEAVQNLVMKSTNINAKNDRQVTPLLLACSEHRIDVVKVLLAAGANPDIGCRDKMITCLQLASSMNSARLVRGLLPYTKDVNRMNLQQLTALHYACSRGNVDIASLLLDAGADPNIVDGNGNNCLHEAVLKDVFDLVAVILRYDVDINAVNEKHHTALFIACAKGKGKVAKLLMEKGADLNVPDSKSNSALHMAIVCDAVYIIIDLIAYGADINFKGQRAMTPLHTAVLQGSDEALRVLLLHSPETDTQDRDGNTPLHVACRNIISKAPLLLQAGASTTIKNFFHHSALWYAVRKHEKAKIEAFITHYSPASLNALIDSKETVLHYFCRKGNVDMVKKLVDCGADKDKVCLQGSPLDAALDNGHENIVRLLIDAGANLSKSSTSRPGFLEKVYRQRYMHIDILNHIILSPNCAINLTNVNGDGETLFFQACKDQAIDVIQLLLDCPREIGIDIPNKFGKSPVAIMCESAVVLENDAVCILSMVLQSGRQVDVDLADYEHMTPLHVACQNGNLLMANMLLRRSQTSVNVGNAMDRTPLHLASTGDLVKLLVEFDADLTRRDYLGQTPLLFSCQQGNQEVASALIKLQPNTIHCRDYMGRTVTHHCTTANILDVLKDVAGLTINDVDINKQSALHIAVMNDNEESVRRLLKMGADPNMRDKCSLSPIHIAQSTRVYDLLCAHKADTTGKSMQGCSPEDMAKWHRDMKDATTMKLYDRIHSEKHDYLRQIIQTQLIGFIEVHAPQENEYIYIKNLLMNFMARLASEVKKIDPLLEFEVMPSGSLNEGTKVCMPDEGDFICLLIKISRMLEPPKKYSFQPANVALNICEDFVGARPDFVGDDGKVITERLFHHFYNVVHQALALPDIWTDFHQLYRIADDDITKLRAKISNVNLMFHGRVFKWLPISVDVVPGILFCGWQPSWCEDRAVLNDTQCCIVAKHIEHAPEDKRPYLFQLGFTDADARMFKVMSPHLKDGYKLAKLMRQTSICKPLRTEHKELPPASAFISSYMLKTVTFHLHEEYLKSPENFQLITEVLPAVQFARWIYDKLAHALKENFLEMYVISAHDLFRNHFKRPGDKEATDLKIAEAYCRQMQSLLDY